MNPDVGPRCPACRLGLVTHEPEDPRCVDHKKDSEVNIPDEAVEAAFSTLRTLTVTGPAKVTRREMRQALEAAAPHLMAPVIALADQWQEDFPYKANQLRDALRSAGAGE